MDSESSADHNPLWVIVIGMACFAAVAVAVIAESSESGEPAESAPYPSSGAATPDLST